MLPSEAFQPRLDIEESMASHDHHLANDTPSTDTDLAYSTSRVHEATISAESNIKEELLSIPPFVATIPPWHFTPQIIDTLKYHAQNVNQNFLNCAL